jgi:hypothetical protein
MLGVLDHFWPPVVLCFNIWDAARIVNWFYYSLTLTIIYYAVWHLHSLQSYTPKFHLWHLHILQMKPSIHTLHRTFRNDLLPRTFFLETRRELTPRIHFLNWAKTANHFAYIARNSETKNGASQLCCVRSHHVMVPSNGFTRSTVASSPCLHRSCLGNECGAVWRHRDMLCSNARCGLARYGTAFNLSRLETARSEHRLPYCCVACLQTSVYLRLLHGINMSILLWHA